MAEAKPQNSWAEYSKKLKQVSSLRELEELEQEIFGRKSGAMTLAMRELKDLVDSEKKTKAKELNEQKKNFVDEIESLKNKLGTPGDNLLIKEDSIDVTLDLPEKSQGHLHPVVEFMRSIEEIFGRMGFDVAYGPEVESEDYNFNKLNIPDDHPARDSQDTFFMKGKKKTVLRTHTSPVQIRYMLEHKPPFRMICPGKTYRKDSDATHSPMFHQFEGLMIDKDISLANLKCILITALRELIGRDVEFRFRTGFFPFTEPSMEMDMMWQGEIKDSREGKWLEMGGCGMVHPNVLRNVKIDPDKWQGFAFGFGIERPIMIKHQIKDIRSFFTSDLRFLKQF